MSKPRIINILEQLGDEVEKQIKQVNNGGCGVFAGQVAAMLQYVDGVENVCVRIGIGSAYGERFNDNVVDKVLAESNASRGEIGNILLENDIVNGHLIVQFDYRGVRYYYDSTNCEPATRNVFKSKLGYTYRLYKGALTPELTLDFADETEHWNSTFDRKQIPKLTKIIETHIGEAASY